MGAMRATDDGAAPWTRYGAALDALRRAEAGASVDGDLTGHSERVAFTTRAIARAAGYDRPVVEMMTVAARFHDVGKLRIDPALMRKPGRFDDDERREMERHASHGHIILSRIDGIDDMFLDAAKYHHERYDGMGYEGLAGEDIPLVARVVAIADVHDALVAKRVYKEAMPESEVLVMMTRDAPGPGMGRGAFDPALLRTFVAVRLDDPRFKAAEAELAAGVRASGKDYQDPVPALRAFAASPLPSPSAPEAGLEDGNGPAVDGPGPR